MTSALRALAICAFLVGGIVWLFRPAKPWWTGRVAPLEPAQEPLSNPLPNLGGWSFRTLATYSITAVVLSKRDYSADEIASFCPTDLLLAWGPASADDVVRSLDFQQYSRFGSWGAQSLTSPSNIPDLSQHIANVHVIPPEPAVRMVLETVRPMDVVSLRGYLVEGVPLHGPAGLVARSSLVRTDSGAGACEILWLESATILPRK